MTIADAVGSILLLTGRPLNKFFGGVNVKIADEQYQVPADARRRKLHSARFRLSAKSSHASLLLLSLQSLLTLRGIPIELARRLLLAIRSYYESEEGKVAFCKWKSRQDAEAQSALVEKKKVG